MGLAGIDGLGAAGEGDVAGEVVGLGEVAGEPGVVDGLVMVVEEVGDVGTEPGDAPGPDGTKVAGVPARPGCAPPPGVDGLLPAGTLPGTPGVVDPAEPGVPAGPGWDPAGLPLVLPAARAASAATTLGSGPVAAPTPAGLRGRLSRHLMSVGTPLTVLQSSVWSSPTLMLPLLRLPML